MNSFETDLNFFLSLASNVIANKETITEKEFRATMALLSPIINKEH